MRIAKSGPYKNWPLWIRDLSGFSGILLCHSLQLKNGLDNNKSHGPRAKTLQFRAGLLLQIFLYLGFCLVSLADSNSVDDKSINMKLMIR